MISSGVLRSMALIALVSVLPLSSCGGGGTEAKSTESFTNQTWATVVADPDSYEGASAELVGRVFNVERDEEGTYMQVWMDARDSGQNTIVGYKNPDFQVSDEDYIRVRGTVGEKFEGENLFGADVTVPTILADSVAIVDAIAAALPAHTTYSAVSSTQGGVRITVTKIEAARDETRVYVRVNNQSASNFSFYAFSGKLVANGRTVTTSFSGDYEEPASDIPARSKTSGVMVFKPIPKDADLRLILEGSSDNYDLGDYGALTWTWSWK